MLKLLKSNSRPNYLTGKNCNCF